MSVLGRRLLAVHASLDEAGIPHAIGGAIALAYCTQEPRGTRDVDINVFVAPDRTYEVFDAMPAEVHRTEVHAARAMRAGQVRLWWNDTPVDLFLNVHAFHAHVEGRTRRVPFEGATIPVIDCLSLAVFKALYGRTRDRADLEDMLAAGSLDRTEALAWVFRLLGPSDPRAVAFGELVGDQRPR